MLPCARPPAPPQNEMPVLVAAAAMGYVEAVRELVNGGAAVDAITMVGEHALAFSVHGPLRARVCPLHSPRRPFARPLQNSETALHVAAASNHADVVRFLLAVPGVNVNARARVRGPVWAPRAALPIDTCAFPPSRSSVGRHYIGPS